MFPELYFFITLIALAIAVYTDLKERMVYNKLTFTLAGIGIVLKAAESYIAQTPMPLFYALAGGIIAYTACYALYRLGVWAGGDVKLVTAIAILNPINYQLIATWIGVAQWPFLAQELPIFGVTLIIYSAFAVLPLGIIMAFSALIKHPQLLKKAIEAVQKKALQLLALGILASGANTIISKFALNDFLVLPIVVIVALLPGKIRVFAIAIAALAGIYLNANAMAQNAIYVTLPLMLGYGLWKLYSESKEKAFKEEIDTQNIEEGMIPENYIVEKNNRIEEVEKPSIKRVINNVMNNRLQIALADFKIEGNVISSPNMAGGLTEDEAKKIRESAKAGLAPEKIKVKKTMAFVPAILLAYILSQIIGDFLWAILA
ncbi:MAG: A24 family peptidase [archaeon]|nr:A24 family peptidase [archaeon]